jgi:hypothetical protein
MAVTFKKHFKGGEPVQESLGIIEPVNREDKQPVSLVPEYPCEVFFGFRK